MLIRIMTGSIKMSREEIDAWKEHSEIDKYITIKEVLCHL